MIIVLGGIDLLWMFFDPKTGGQNIWTVNSTLNISGYFIAVVVTDVIVLLINTVLRRAMFRAKRVSMKVWKAIVFSEAAIGFVVILTVLNRNSMHFFDCTTWVTLAVSAVYLLAYYPTRGKKTRREKIKFSALVREEAEKPSQPRWRRNLKRPGKEVSNAARVS